MFDISGAINAFLLQPLDVILVQIFMVVGVVPTAIILFWGFSQMWQNARQGAYVKKLKYVLLAISVPPLTEQTPKAVENLFSNLFGAKSSLLWKDKWMTGKLQSVFSFEIVSDGGSIQFYVRCEARMRDLVEAALYASYPDAEISEVDDYTIPFPDRFPDEKYDMWGTEFKLKKPGYLPIRTHADFEDRLAGELKDPLAQILEQMGKMKPGEHFLIQLCCQPPNDEKWKDKGSEFVQETYTGKKAPKKSGLDQLMEAFFFIPSELLRTLTGIGFFSESDHEEKPDPFRALSIDPIKKEIAEAVTRKIGKLAYRTKLRVVYISRKEVYFKPGRAPIVKGVPYGFGHLHMNSFGLHSPMTPADDYFWQVWTYFSKQRKLLRAYKKRSMSEGAEPSMLNIEELASIWHFPAIGVKAPLVVKTEARRAEPPVELPIEASQFEAPLPLGPSVGSDEEPDTDQLVPSIEMPVGIPTMQDLPVPSIPSPSAASAPDDLAPPNLPI
ncbi:hypothetical protein HYV73_01085 [Candidatus Uhrbacteria bacterium]|nr:hypothetical protein [Candidatus Uhrbacteria bacterium]